MRFRLFAFLAVLLVPAWLAAGEAAHAQSASSSLVAPGKEPDGPKVHVTLVAEHQGVTPGGTVTLALREDIREHWHTYWKNPGDSGEPTGIDWALPQGWSAGKIQWPYPSQIPVGPLMNYGYADNVTLLIAITAPTNAIPGTEIELKGRAHWLVCSDICIPEEADVSLPIKVQTATPPLDSGVADLFRLAREKLPRDSQWSARFDADNARFALFVESSELANAKPKSIVFFPETDGYISAAAQQSAEKNSQGIVIATKPDWRLDNADKRAKISEIKGLLKITAADGQIQALNITATKGEVPQLISTAAPLAGANDGIGSAGKAESNIGVWQALLFAFLGGLILNLMPCVFPVLSMKVLALTRKVGAVSVAHTESLAYAAGVVATFGLLAGLLLMLRTGGEAIGWGFQLQNPLVVAIFALVIFSVGLNLSGVFEISGGRFAGIGQKFAAKGGHVGSFFTGALAVVVATPCTAPFMGAAMGFALIQPAAVALSIFLALAIGFAAPFVVLGYSPVLLRFLPRPGPWMATFKQLLAFPMYGAAIWLVWVLDQQAGAGGVLAVLGAALALALAFWAFGASQRAYGIGQLIGMGLAALSLGVAIYLVPQVPQVQTTPTQEQATAGSRPAFKSTLASEPYSEARLVSLREAGRPVFVYATAAWCITCLVNEKAALSGTQVADAIAGKNIAVLKADWTNRNPEITKLLSAYGRSGVPLYLYYTPGSEQAEVLPQVLTKGTILATFSRGDAIRTP
jgi:thiol:disulfide interchange protein DsbD